jgi:hypothetical protein
MSYVSEHLKGIDARVTHSGLFESESKRDRCLPCKYRYQRLCDPKSVTKQGSGYTHTHATHSQASDNRFWRLQARLLVIDELEGTVFGKPQQLAPASTLPSPFAVET